MDNVSEEPQISYMRCMEKKKSQISGQVNVEGKYNL